MHKNIGMIRFKIKHVSGTVPEGGDWPPKHALVKSVYFLCILYTCAGPSGHVV